MNFCAFYQRSIGTCSQWQDHRTTQPTTIVSEVTLDDLLSSTYSSVLNTYSVEIYIVVLLQVIRRLTTK